MEALRKQRIEEMGNPEKLEYSDICMDGFEDLMLNNLSWSYEAYPEDIKLNNGIIDIGSGLAYFNHDKTNAEYCLVNMLSCYKLLLDDVQRPEMKEAMTKRIHGVLGQEHDFDFNFKSFQGMMVKTFIRRKRLNDAVRTTIVCSAEEELAIRNHLGSDRMKQLRANGLLSVKDDLFSKKAWPVLKILIPGCSYLYQTEEEREDNSWTRMVYGIEMHITGPEFMNLKESMHEEYEVMRIDKATRDFLDLRPFQLGNLEVLVAFLRAMDKKNGDGEVFLRISRLEAMMKERERLYKEEGIDLQVDFLFREEAIQKRIQNFKAIVEKEEEYFEGLLHF